MLTLIHAPRSRSTRLIFLLEEIGVPYQIKVVNIRRSDGNLPLVSLISRALHIC